MAAPALAVAWIGQQPIDQLLIPVGGGGGFHFLERARLRWEADQIEVESAHQLRSGRLWLWYKPLLLMRLRQKSIDRVFHPCRIGDGWHLRMHQRLKRPVVAGRGFRCFVSRRRGPRADPGLSQRHLLWREWLPLPFRRHPLGEIGCHHAGQQQAAGWISGLDCAACFSPLPHQGHGVEPQARFLLEAAVAGGATLGQQRLEHVCINGQRLGSRAISPAGGTYQSSHARYPEQRELETEVLPCHESGPFGRSAQPSFYIPNTQFPNNVWGRTLWQSAQAVQVAADLRGPRESSRCIGISLLFCGGAGGEWLAQPDRLPRETGPGQRLCAAAG